MHGEGMQGEQQPAEATPGHCSAATLTGIATPASKRCSQTTKVANLKMSRAVPVRTHGAVSHSCPCSHRRSGMRSDRGEWRGGKCESQRMGPSQRKSRRRRSQGRKTCLLGLPVPDAVQDGKEAQLRHQAKGNQRIEAEPAESTAKQERTSITHHSHTSQCRNDGTDCNATILREPTIKATHLANGEMSATHLLVALVSCSTATVPGDGSEQTRGGRKDTALGFEEGGHCTEGRGRAHDAGSPGAAR